MSDDNLLARIKSRRVVPREDSLLNAISLTPVPEDSSKPVSIKSQIEQEIKQIESDIFDNSLTIQRTGICLQKQIAIDLATFATKKRVSIEAVVESMWLIAQGDKELKEKITDVAHTQYRQRADLGAKRKKLTNLKKKLQGIH